MTVTSLVRLPLRTRSVCGVIRVADDSYMNTKAAQALGWTAAHLVEPSQLLPATQACRYQIRSLEELRDIYPQFFQTTGNGFTNGA